MIRASQEKHTQSLIGVCQARAKKMPEYRGKNCARRGVLFAAIFIAHNQRISGRNTNKKAWWCQFDVRLQAVLLTFWQLKLDGLLLQVLVSVRCSVVYRLNDFDFKKVQSVDCFMFSYVTKDTVAGRYETSRSQVTKWWSFRGN